MPFTIRAHQDGLPVFETRSYAGSALVLARKWTTEGRQAIVIVTSDGRTHSLEQAQEERTRRLHSGRRIFA